MSELTDCINNLSAKDIIRAAAKTANGVPFYINTLGLGGFCEEYQRIYNDLAGSGTPPGDAIADAQNTMVCGMVEDGVWAKLDVFYNYAQTTNAASEALMNWTASGLYNAVAVNNPPFTALEGFLGIPIPQTHIDCNWNPSVNGVNYTLNDSSVGVYIRTNVNEDKVDIGCNSGVPNTRILSRLTADGCYSKINENTYLVAANTDSRGMYILTRTGANARRIYRNKISIANDAQVSIAIPNADLYVLADNNNGAAAFWGSKQISMAFASSSFTQTDVDNLTDRFETYMDSNGKGVIP